MFNAAFRFRKKQEFLHLLQATALQLFANSKTLFDVISKGTRTSEKRLMLDVVSAGEEFKGGEISNIGFIRSDYNLAGGLTKQMNQAKLKNVLTTGKLSIKVEQWIVRDGSNSDFLPT